MNLIYVLSIYLLLGVSLSSAYRIFAVFPMNGKSHFSVLEQIAKGLAEKGHQVDVVSYFPQKEPFPNYTDVVTFPSGEHANLRYSDVQSRSIIIQKIHEYCRFLCNQLSNPDLMKIIKNPPVDRPYDLVLVHFLHGYQCFSAIGHVWGVPVVGVVTTTLYPYNHDFIGTPLNLAYAPKNLMNYKVDMSFWDRLYNFFMTHYVIHEYHSESYKQNDLIKKYYGPDMPHYLELEKSVSLIITNSHPSLHGVQPKVPALVEVGGIHITDDNSTIQPTLKKLLDESENGFIYVSFGTIAIIESYPKEILEKFYSSFRKLSPVRIIMKSANPTALPKNMPDNLFTFPWLPQRKILQHPNIKAFVTHGGGLGTQETVYYGVPTICIPFFADQHVNCDISFTKNFGIKLDIKSGSQEDYDHAFQEILTNPKYKDSVKKLSYLYRDRPMQPKEEAAYWIDYVIRHGKDALRSPSVDLKWWQIELFDIYLFIVTCVIVITSIVGIVLTLITRRILSILPSSIENSMRSHKKIN